MGNDAFAGMAFKRLYESCSPETRDHAAAWIAIACADRADLVEALVWARRIANPVTGGGLSSYYLGLQGRFEGAEAAARRALEANPRSSMCHTMVACALKGRRQHKEAMESCQEAIECDEGSLAAHHTMAEICYDLGRFQEALAHTRKALTLQPDNPPTLVNLGVLLAREGKLEEGLQYLEKSYFLKPSAVVCEHIALIIERLHVPDFIDRQCTLYEQAARLAPQRVSLWGNWGIMLLEKLGKPEEALEKMLKAETLAPGSALVCGHLAVIYEQLGEKERSVAYYRKAIEALPPAVWQNVDFVMDFANVLAIRCTYREIRHEGLALLEKAAGRWPGDQRVLTDYSVALFHNDRRSEAYEVVGRALEIGSGYLHAHSSPALAPQIPLGFYYGGLS